MRSIKLDVSVRKDVLRNPDTKYLLPAYQDITTFTVPVMNIEKIIAEEIASVLERDRMRDIYDLYFLLALRRMKHDESPTREK